MPEKLPERAVYKAMDVDAINDEDTLTGIVHVMIEQLSDFITTMVLNVITLSEENQPMPEKLPERAVYKAMDVDAINDEDTLTGIVHVMIEQLSDFITTMVLNVITLSEENQPMPEKLPESVDNLSENANMLSLIAIDMASGFESFPDVYQQIIDAANENMEATTIMTKAILFLRDPDTLALGWDKLMDSYRIMGERVITLLEIIYGADIQRIEGQAQVVLDKMIDFAKNLELAKGTPTERQGLADKGTNLTGDALQLAQYLLERANDAKNPHTKKKLTNLADLLNEQAQDFINKLNDYISNPNDEETRSRLLYSMRNLKDTVDRGSKVARDTFVDIAIPDMNEASQHLLPKYISNTKDALGSVKEEALACNNDGFVSAARLAKENLSMLLSRTPEMLQDNAGKMNKLFPAQVRAGKQVLLDPDNKLARSALENETKNLFRALENLKTLSELDDHKKADLIDSIKNIAKILEQSISDPFDKAQFKGEMIKDSLKKIRDGFNNDNIPAVIAAVKMLPQNLNEFVDLIKETGDYNRLSSSGKEKLDKQFDHLENKMVEVVQDVKQCLNDPDNIDSRNKLNDSINKLSSSLEHLLNIGAFPGRSEKVVRDTSKELLEEMISSIDSAKQGDGVSLKKNTQNINDLLSKLNKASKRRMNALPEDKQDPALISEINELIDDFNQKVEEALTNGDLIPELDNLIEVASNKFIQLNDLIHANEIASIIDIEDLLDDLIFAIDSNNEELFEGSINGLNDDHLFNPLLEHINALEDTTLKNSALEIIDNLGVGVESVISSAQIRMEDPDNEGKFKSLMASVIAFTSNLARLRNILDLDSLDREPESSIKGARAAVLELQDGIKNNQGNKEENVENVRELCHTAVQQCKNMAKQSADSRQIILIDAAIEDLEGLLHRMDSNLDDESVLNTSTQVDDALKSLYDAIKYSDQDQSIRGSAQANNILSHIDIHGDIDSSYLLEVANKLSELMRGLIDFDASLTPGELSERARAALALQCLLKSLESGEHVDTSTAIESIIQKNLPTEESSESIEQIEEPLEDKWKPVENPQNVEDMLDKVAYDIQTMNENIDEENSEAEVIAKELFNLASAARNGDKATMLLASRAITGQIKIFCRNLSELAEKIPCKNVHQKNVQNRLYQNAEGLENLGIQLKILVSVKAASISDCKDTDESLTSLARTLGTLFTDSLNSMDSTQKSILRTDS
eukprot:TRINITY_DN8431_c0_g1_i1.p1 TRINITY_DN8431_c0_g1~~TRINITY_DN8431_c0_g1_i1.p1  ORF type:complete len:1210 (-),score=345.98 TRINITY_DN8431_c0_g1_i1:14-3643(-)